MLTVRQVPGIADWSADSGRWWEETVAAHQALLDGNPAIQAAYYAVPDPITLYGLPMAPVTDLGNVLVLRAQRVVIQQWKEAVPWAAAGQVTVANGGDVAKEAGLLPAAAIVPTPATPGATTPSAPPTPTTTVVPTTPGQPSVTPRELRLALAVDNVNPPAGGRVTLRATVTDEAGQPVPGAVIAVIAEYAPTDYADFAPHTNAQGQTSLAIPLPASTAGQAVTIRAVAVFAELGIAQEISVTPR